VLLLSSATIRVGPSGGLTILNVPPARVIYQDRYAQMCDEFADQRNRCARDAHDQPVGTWVARGSSRTSVRVTEPSLEVNESRAAGSSGRARSLGLARVAVRGLVVGHRATTGGDRRATGIDAPREARCSWRCVSCC